MNKLQLIFLSLFFTSCANHGPLTFITELPLKLNENSGIIHFQNSKVWLVEDNGNGDNLYEVDFKGNLLREIKVKNAKNHDWEYLAKDKKGNIYIGDFGNNDNDRKNLVIYKIPDPRSHSKEKTKAKKISFNYPEQKKFPPSKNKRIYDAEAFFHFKDHLYIFTKNRAKPFTGETSIYKVPGKEGSYKAVFMGEIKLCADWDTCKVTSADISSDGKTIVLLGCGILWTITDFSIDGFSSGSIQEIDLGIRSQLESVCFKDDNTLLLSDERKKGLGGNLYSYRLKK